MITKFKTGDVVSMNPTFHYEDTLIPLDLKMTVEKSDKFKNVHTVFFDKTGSIVYRASFNACQLQKTNQP